MRPFVLPVPGFRRRMESGYWHPGIPQRGGSDARLARRAGLLAVITLSLAACGQTAAPPPGGRTPASQLRHAAVLVNAGIGTTSMRFTPATMALRRHHQRRSIPGRLHRPAWLADHH